MSVSSIALSSLATGPAATTPTAAEGSRAARSADDRPVRPTPSQDERQPVKAALPRKVGQAIDISA